MESLPTFVLYPRTITEDRRECLLILTKDVIKTEVKVDLQIPSKIKENVQFEMKDSRSLVVAIPDSYIQHDSIMLYLSYRGEVVGADTVRVERPGELLARVLERALDPVQLMMSALGLRSGSDADLHSLDQDLARVVAYNTPADQLKALFRGYNTAPKSADCSTAGRHCRFPTALHFAAHYGLIQLTKNLLKCDGAMACLDIINSEGNTPKAIAQSSGFKDIVWAIEDAAVYSSVDDGPDSPYVSMNKVPSSAAIAIPGSVPPPPTTPPPSITRNRSGSLAGSLQSISEDAANPEIRVRSHSHQNSTLIPLHGKEDSGFMDRESYASGGSADGTYDGGSGDGEYRTGRGKKVTRSHPVSAVGHGQVVHGGGKAALSSGSRHTSRRPSLPDVFAPQLYVGREESPPPPMCPGPTYQNIGSKMPPPVPHKKNSLPAVLDMTELQNNHVFMKQRKSKNDQ